MKSLDRRRLGRAGLGFAGVLGVAVLIGLAACSLPGPTRPGAESPTPAPTASVAATPSPTAEVSPTPVATASEASEISDRFWDPIIQQLPPILMDHQFETLVDMTASADLVVRGRILEVYVGEQWVGSDGAAPEQFAYARIEIGEILKGEPVSRNAGSVEVQLALVGDDWEAPNQSFLPGHDHLLFLIHEATFREQIGKPARSSGIAPYAYFIPTAESVLRDIDGVVRLVERDQFASAYGDHFALALHGRDFSELVEEVGRVSVGP